MNDIELARLFVEYSEIKAKLAELAMYIETAVLEKKETIKIAGVTATYYRPSHETPDYEGAAVALIGESPELKDKLILYQTPSVSTAWKKFCEDMGLTPEPGPEKPAKVVIK
jgi:hypothetical protein